MVDHLPDVHQRSVYGDARDLTHGCRTQLIAVIGTGSLVFCETVVTISPQEPGAVVFQYDISMRMCRARSKYSRTLVSDCVWISTKKVPGHKSLDMKPRK